MFNSFNLMKINIVNKIFILVLSVVLFAACQHSTTNQPKVQDESRFELIRFEQLFNETTKESFSDLRQTYPYLFPGDYPDNYWLAYRQDTMYSELYTRVDKKFHHFDQETRAIGKVFANLKQIYPSFTSPKVITLISGLDLNNQVIYADSLLLISLDNYLGKSSDVYVSFPDYIKHYLTSERIPIDVATALVNHTFTPQPNPVFVERMVDAGKEKYAIQQLLPETNEAQLFNYSKVKMAWAEDNEYSMWQYFMEKECLYDSDRDLVRRFLDPAPFSKFYIKDDKDSPGQVGAWMGWRIVNSYADKHDVSLPELLATPSMEIFKQSNYKPNK